MTLTKRTIYMKPPAWVWFRSLFKLMGLELGTYIGSPLMGFSFKWFWLTINDSIHAFPDHMYIHAIK